MSTTVRMTESDKIADTENFVLNPMLREKIGYNARLRVTSRYNWADNVSQMVDVYQKKG